MHTSNRRLLDQWRAALYAGDMAASGAAAKTVFATDALLQIGYPFETLSDLGALQATYVDLQAAVPDLERRDYIVMAGPTHHGTDWVGCCGYYTGTFAHAWLDIPPTGHQFSMRFHEFFRVEDGRVQEMQAVWDIPEVMLQAGVWPLAPSLGREWLVPGPATQDGLRSVAWDQSSAEASYRLVMDMVDGLGRYAEGGVEAMDLPRYWHPHCSWYGPAGIGTARGIEGFRNWHQIPFLNGMPDRVGSGGEGNLFADGDYVGFTAWPGMHMSISADGWLGIAPAGQQINMRSLDFWRCENGLIRENWVLVDLLDVYHQIGVDVFARMRELARSRRYST